MIERANKQGVKDALLTVFTLDKTEHDTARHGTGAMPSACVYTAIVKVGPKCARS